MIESPRDVIVLLTQRDKWQRRRELRRVFAMRRDAAADSIRDPLLQAKLLAGKS